MSDSRTADWLDDFFATFYACWPVDATFIGVHDHDWRFADYSENGAGDVHAELAALLERADALEPTASPLETIDRRLAEGFLRLRLMEYESEHFHRGNPSVYTGEAIFGVLSLLLTDHAPLSSRVQAASERLAAVPALLGQGRRNVRRAPAAWTERALRECGAARSLLTRGVDRLVSEGGGDHAALRVPASEAARAFDGYASWLESGLRHHDVQRWGVGEDFLARVLRDGHCLEESADDIAARAERAASELAPRLHEEARALGATSTAALLARLADQHPTVDDYYARFEIVWRAMREVAESEALLTWPDFPIRYVPRPSWIGDSADPLYYLAYRSPAAFDRPDVHEYHVPRIDVDEGPERVLEKLRVMNDATIKLNHVIHHGGIGHHVQNWHAYGSRSRIGQVAAVDCASRIAMTCGGTMAEGWACYATDLMAEAGGLTPLERFANRQAWLRMCARAVVDVRLHQGRYTLDQAVTHYVERAGMPLSAARAEAVRNSMYPGAAMIYFVGADAIHALRREVAARRGSSFTLQGFHDEFLSWGSIPVPLIAQEMLRDW